MSELSKAFENLMSAFTDSISAFAGALESGRFAEREVDRKIVSSDAVSEICIDVDSAGVVVIPISGNEIMFRLVMYGHEATADSSLCVEANDGYCVVKVNHRIGEKIGVEVAVPYSGVVVRVNTNRGNIVIRGLDVKGVDVKSDTGNVVCKEVRAQRFSAVSVSGNVVAKRIFTQDPINISSKYGNVLIKND